VGHLARARSGLTRRLDQQNLRMWRAAPDGPRPLHRAASATVSLNPIDDRGFPYARCKDYSCSASPVSLQLASQTQAPDDNQVCFSIVDNGCSSSNSCCGALADKIGKLDFSMGA
jgi:hypothetical protein